jgi:menaquinone-dependent protoporphyrinogen oxidase
MNVLIAVDSRHGATTEIAYAIAGQLNLRGVKATVADAAEVHSVAPYDGVVLGSAVYTGHWMNEAKRLAAREQANLVSRPVWLFSSGPIGDPPFPDELPADADAVRALTNARDHRVFGGKLDRASLGLLERAMVSAVKAPEGDYRDWAEIRAFAGEIADALLPVRSDG